MAGGYMPRFFGGRTIMKRTISEDQVIAAAAAVSSRIVGIHASGGGGDGQPSREKGCPWAIRRRAAAV